MKSFCVTENYSKKQTTGGTLVKSDVYRIKNNLPVYIGEVIWNTASYKGIETETMNFIAKSGNIQKKYKDGYYKCDNPHFRIHLV